MQPAQGGHTFRRGAQHQMVGVAQQDICARRGHAFGHHRLDRRRRAHGHEGGRADLAARGLDHAAACLAVLRVFGKSGAGHTLALSGCDWRDKPVARNMQ